MYVEEFRVYITCTVLYEQNILCDFFSSIKFFKNVVFCFLKNSITNKCGHETFFSFFFFV